MWFTSGRPEKFEGRVEGRFEGRLDDGKLEGRFDGKLDGKVLKVGTFDGRVLYIAASSFSAKGLGAEPEC